MKNPQLWLRAETKAFERRTPLIPDCAAALVGAGFEVSVEASAQRIYDASAYEEAGCRIVDPGSWPEAGKGSVILGLKELPEATFPLTHDHVYFAHAYKEQQGWQDLLARFRKGGGTLYDLEYLTDEKGKRVAAFGYWAGFAGAASGLLAWAHQKQGRRPPLGPMAAYENQARFVDEIVQALRPLGTRPRVLVIGAKGRCGRGAVEAVRAAGAEVVEWDLEETRAGGPFDQILEMDIFVNCVFVNSAVPPFLTGELLQRAGRALSLVVDVSCDVSSRLNPLPIYTACTDFREPCAELIPDPNPLHLIAIDHLPTLLPRESSEDYARQLLPHLMNLGDPSNPVWQGAAKTFHDHSARAAAHSKEAP